MLPVGDGRNRQSDIRRFRQASSASNIPIKRRNGKSRLCVHHGHRPHCGHQQNRDHNRQQIRSQTIAQAPQTAAEPPRYAPSQAGWQPGEYTLPGNISSQFITGLLFALPILDGDSSLRLTTKLESAGYVDLSLDVLRDFGIDIRIDTDENGFITYNIKGGQKYTEPEGLSIEGDWSNAAFWLACGALGGDIICDGLKADSSQRDREVLTVLQDLGASITTEAGSDGLTTVICRAPGKHRYRHPHKFRR